MIIDIDDGCLLESPIVIEVVLSLLLFLDDLLEDFLEDIFSYVVLEIKFTNEYYYSIRKKNNN